jgi:hypothetical protein
MTIQYTITLTEAENLALGYVALSQQDWIDNLTHERCRIAIDEIVAICVEKCLSNGIQVPGSKEEIIVLSFEKGWIKSAEDRNQEILNSTKPE